MPESGCPIETLVGFRMRMADSSRVVQRVKDVIDNLVHAGAVFDLGEDKRAVTAHLAASRSITARSAPTAGPDRFC